MPAIPREALNSKKLAPCWTLMIFSFMVAFTLSILDLAVNITALHLPVLIMWIITITTVLLTAIYWLCQSWSIKRLREGNLERRSLSPQYSEGRSERETVSYGMESKTKCTDITTNE